MNTSQTNALALRNAARWSSIGYEIPIVPDCEEEKGRLTGHDKKRGGQRRKEWCKGGRRERLQARLRVRSSIQKRGTQERPWIYVDVSPEVSEKEKGPTDGREAGWGAVGAEGKNICRLCRRVNATRLFLT